MKDLNGLPKLLRDYLRDAGGWVESSTLEERAWYHRNGTRYKPASSSPWGSSGVGYSSNQKLVSFTPINVGQGEALTAVVDGTTAEISVNVEQ